MRSLKPLRPAVARLHLVMILLFSLALGAASGLGEPEPPADSEAAELMGAVVFAADGSQVGEVTAVSTGADGQISEIRMTRPSPLGLGDRTVVLPKGRYMTLRGAVVLDLSTEEVDALPSASQQSSA